MNLSKLPVISPDVLAAHLPGEAVLLHLGTKEYFRLNETGAVIWKALEEHCDVDGVLDRLTTQFDIESPAAEAALRMLLVELTERRLLVVNA